jgi:hypothetical protein
MHWNARFVHNIAKFAFVLILYFVVKFAEAKIKIK